MDKRPFRLWLYLVVVCALSWPFQVLSALGPRTLAWAVAMNGLSMVMVGVATFICARYLFRDGLAGAGWRWGAGRYYLQAVGLALLVWGLPAAVDLALGNLHLPRTLSWGKGAWIAWCYTLILIPAFGEEIGWRGYLLPHMVRSMASPRAAVTWHGVIWGLWHAPLLIGIAPLIEDQAAGMLPAVTALAATVTASILTIFIGAIFASLWARSGSIAVVTVLHAAYDGVRDSLGIATGGVPSQGWSPLITVVIGALIWWRFGWKALRPAAEPAARSLLDLAGPAKATSPAWTAPQSPAAT